MGKIAYEESTEHLVLPNITTMSNCELIEYIPWCKISQNMYEVRALNILIKTVSLKYPCPKQIDSLTKMSNLYSQSTFC